MDDGTLDELKGRAKQAAGDLTGDQELEREGKVDRASGWAKERLEDAKDTVDEIKDKVKDNLDRDR